MACRRGDEMNRRARGAPRCSQQVMRLSIVVPVVNEGRDIASALAALQPLRAHGHEIIVVDGGSRDRTLALATPLADRALGAPPGRSSQLNAGAAEARRDTLLFLHADTRLPANAIEAIARALHAGYRWGRFDVAIEGASPLLPLVATMMNLRSRMTGIATGDQAIFVCRDTFEAAGGFPPLPLMEDVALSKILKRTAGRPACLRERVVTSGRRFDARGAIRTIAAMSRLRFDYWRGVDPAALAQRYPPHAPPGAPTLQIFAKDPLPGKVKTRLAAVLGDAAAADLYHELALRTLAMAAAARDAGVVGDVELWCDPNARCPVFADWRDRFGVSLRTQRGNDLGARMRSALSSALSRGTAAILIGTDCPVLDIAYLEHAAAALADHDVVLGPAEDGGYVLVGMSRDVDIFSGVPWSTAGVMAATRGAVVAQRISATELPTLWDIDTVADLPRYRTTIDATVEIPSPARAAL
jgi:rSAM/selenodomain-associated transferase 2/rSAM/selenodomain-associated transferase 1